MTLFQARSLAAVIICAIFAGSAMAATSLRPGERFGRGDSDRLEGLVSPGVQWMVRNGLPITVGEAKPIERPKEYREATEKYAAQVKLASDGVALENYVAGQPFPEIDPNDPDAATKIMWNYEHSGWISDSLDVRNFDSDTGPMEANGPIRIERHFLLDKFRVLNYLGRLHHDPKPTWKTNEGYQAQSGLYPILEPYDLQGVGGISYRYEDADKQDDTWLYLPALRRVRRLSTAQRSDALFGQDIDVDSFGGYAGQIAWMDWKLVGEKEMLAPVHAKHFPVEWAEKADWAFDDVWEKRDAWIVEGVSKLKQYAYSKRVIVLDKESSVVLYSDLHDPAGELWKVFVNLFAFREKPTPAATDAVYPSEMPFNPGVIMVDVQQNHVTRVALPSRDQADEEGFYFNMEEDMGIEPGWFTVASLIAEGR